MTPKIREVRRKPSGGFHVWAVCIRCGNPRWSTSTQNGRHHKELCRKCSTAIRGHQNSKALGEASANLVYSEYRRNARRLNRNFTISRAKFFKIVRKLCYYCGAEPANIRVTANATGSFIYNGLDRIDSKKGYTLDNVVSCCFKCNSMKRQMTKAEFFEQCKRIVLYQNLP